MSSRIDDLRDAFLKQGLYLRNWSPRTVRTYKQAFSSFQAALRDTGTLEESASRDLPQLLTKSSLEAWVIWLREKGVSAGGCNMYIRTFNSFLSWLKEEGHQTPAQLKIKLLPNPRKPLRGLSDVEIRSILSFRPKGFFELRTWTLINCLLDTGCRIDEVLRGLEMSKVNLDELHFTVTGKGNKVRQVPFSLEFRKLLFRYMQVREKRLIQKSDIMFCTGEGNHLSYRNTFRDIKYLCKKIGVEGEHVHPHAFRHCFAVTYIRRGGDIYRLSRILGHQSISTTQLYLRSMVVEHLAENHSQLTPLSRAL